MVQSVVSLKEGRYAILEADLDDGRTPIGVLLEDPRTNQLYVRLRRDWDQIAADDPVLPLLEDDLNDKASEMGAGQFLEWLEANLSANLRATDREAVTVYDFRQTLDRLYARHVPSRFSAATHVPRYSLRS